MAHRVRAVDAPADETLLRLAVLLQAGVSPARAWAYLADSGDPAAARVQIRIEAGVALVTAISQVGDEPASGAQLVRGRRRADPGPGVWREIAAAWAVATVVGAPLADSLRSLALTLRDVQEAGDDVRIALAEPAATARLMGLLPFVAVLLGVALGFDALGTLVRNPMGIACLVAGVVLIFVGQQWNAALVRRARAGGAIPGLDAELLAIALSGGVSIDRARSLVAAALKETATPATSALTATPARRSQPDAAAVGLEAATASVLALSRTAGVPAVELLRASAAMSRHRARVDGKLRAARLSSRLLLPLGVCTLPAFLLLGVAPMLLSVMTAVPLSL